MIEDIIKLHLTSGEHHEILLWGQSLPTLSLGVLQTNRYGSRYDLVNNCRLYTCTEDLTYKNAIQYFNACEYTLVIMQGMFFADIGAREDYNNCCRYMESRLRGPTSSNIFMKYV